MTEFSDLIIAKIKEKWGDAVVPIPDEVLSDDVADWPLNVYTLPSMAGISELTVECSGSYPRPPISDNEMYIDVINESDDVLYTHTITDIEGSSFSFTVVVDIASYTEAVALQLRPEYGASIELTTAIVTASYVQPSFLPLPRFIDDFTLASSESSQYDVIYIQESSETRQARGVGGKDRQEDLLMQLHLYGPNVTRGYKVRDELERIIDDRSVRVRLDDTSLLFSDNRTRRAMKVGYGYVYDIRVRSMRGLN
ncbi:MAG: hypothetical protein EOM68_26740 [Spirochaetia bacterium]|nr:hypothetical protein [Spirochaetia bacterium]